MASKSDKRSVAIAIMIVAIMVFPVAMFMDTGENSQVSAESQSRETTITYVDPYGTNSSTPVVYYGIPATEYNPLYWDLETKWTSPVWVADSGNGTPNYQKAKLGTAKVLVPFTVQYLDEYNDVSGDYIVINGVTKSFAEWNINKADPRQNEGKVIKISMPTDVTVPAYTTTATSNPLAKEVDDEGSTGKNENRFKFGDANDEKFSLTYHYNGNCIYIRVNSLLPETVDNLLDISNKTEVTCGFYADLTLSGDQRTDVEVDPVFGGWKNGDQLVYPGDVVPLNTTRLTANWVYPDIRLISSTLATSSITASTQTPALVQPTGGWNANTEFMSEHRIADFSDASTFTDWYHEVGGVYISGKSDDMFRMIYLLEPSSADNSIDIDGTNPIVGTYRSYDSPDTDAQEKVTLLMKGNMTMNGDVTIDNVKLKQVTSTQDRLARDTAKSMINANQKRLILGTGIDTLAGNSDTIYYAPVVYGGNSNKATFIENKTIVAANFTDGQSLKVDLGTFVIIHSGTYSHVLGGGNIGDTGTSVINGENKSKNRSTYLVIKGATVLGVVSGSGESNSPTVRGGADNLGYLTGGTFVYAYNLKMVGDKYEDMASGVTDRDILYAHANWRIDESSALQGGNYRGKVYGSTHVFLSGTSSVFEVAAGGRNAASMCNNTYLEISGKATVRHVACGTVIDGSEAKNNCVGNVYIRVADDAKVATLLGGGYDTYTLTTYPSKYGGSINIDVFGGTLGYVYGGGMRGTIGDEDNLTTIYLNISGGTILKDVFGGGRGGLDKIHHKAETSNPAPTGQLGRFDSGDITKSYGPGTPNSTGYSQVYGTINVSISGGVVNGNVYGGGESTPAVATYYSATRNWNGNASATDNVSAVYGTTSVAVSGGTIKGSVYGAGKGIDIENDSLNLDYVDLHKVATTNGSYKYTSWEGKKLAYYAAIILMKDDGDLAYIPWMDVTFDANNKANVTFKTTDSSSKYEVYAAIHGVSNVVISGTGVVEGNVYGGGAYGQVIRNGTVGGNTNVTVSGGEIKTDVFGGGVGHKDQMSVVGNRTVMMTSGSIGGNLYGGSKVGNDGQSPTLTSNSTIVVSHGTIVHSIFGGGLLGKTWGNTAIYVGYDMNEGGSISPVDKDNISIPSGKIVVESIYAGGNVDSDEDPFERPLVMGHGSIKVYGAKLQPYIEVSGSIMGSGNACLTDLSTDVELRDFWNSKQLTGLHRITNLNVIGSNLKITGRSPLTDIAGQMKIVSIYGVEKLTLQNDTTIAIDHLMDEVGQLVSLNKDGVYTTVQSPSNKIVFTSGAMVYIRSVTKEDSGYIINYGSVSGYTNIQVTGATSYGAYILGSLDSVGGFTVAQDGTYREADISDSTDSRCWFISGIVKKTSVINLSASSQSGRTVYSGTHIDITKLQDDTSLMYVGGSFTPISNDQTTSKAFSFVRPGDYADTSELGLALGYYDSDVQNSIYDPTIRYMDVGAGMQNVRGTFYSDKTYSEEESGRKNLTSVVMEYNGTSRGAGTYSVNLSLSGAPAYKTAYVGYLILNFQEVLVVSYESEGEGQVGNEQQILISNKIEVRIDIYIFGSETDTNYSVIMKTDKTESEGKTYRSGNSSILIPSGFSMQPLTLDSIEALDQDDSHVSGTPSGTMVVKAKSNADNTLGWASISQGTTWDFDEGEVVGDGYVGTLLGNVVATVEYDLSGFRFVVKDDDNEYEIIPYKLRMTFIRTTSAGAVGNTVDIILQDKGTHDVDFWDRGIKTTITYVEGTTLDYNNCKKPSGANFNGWYLDENYVNRYDYNMEVYRDGIELFARYSYVVTFDNMNGTYSEMYVAEDVGGSLISEKSVPIPKYPGYKFAGWYKEKERIQEWDYSSDRVTENTKLYAKWEGLEIIVHFWYEDADHENAMTLFGYDSDIDEIVRTVADQDGENEGKFDLSKMYMMNRDIEAYPLVQYGSTFDEIDPYNTQGTNILAFVESVIDDAGGFGGEFVRWEVISPTGNRIPVYKDTGITDAIVALVNQDELRIDYGNSYWNYYLVHDGGYPRYWGDDEMDAPNYMEINLVAVAAKIGIVVDMVPDDQSYASSISIEAPVTRTVFPNHSEGDSSKLYIQDTYGQYYCKDVCGVVSRPITITCVDYNVTTESYDEVTATYGLDRFGNLFEEIPDEGFQFSGMSLVYKMVSETENTYLMVWSENKAYLYDNADGKFSDLSSVDGIYMKDTAGHTYPGVSSIGGAIPVLEPVPYYEFVYKLNNAARSGYELIGWHNNSVDEAYSLDPSAGTTRVLKVSFVEDGGKIKVTGAVIEDTYNSGLPATVPMSISGTKYLDVFDQTLHVEYETIWNAVEYHVNVSSVTEGTVNAFLVRYSSGVENRIYIDDWSGIHFYYGDKLEISYTPDDVSKNHFGGWIITGEYTIDDASSASSTVVVLGNCSITASEYTDTVIDVLIKYDGGFLSDTDNKYTKVFLYDTITGEEYSTMMINKTLVGQLYRAKVPLFSTYEVHIKYGVDGNEHAPGFSDVPDVYRLKGEIVAEVGGESTFLYTVISARFVGTQTIDTYDSRSTLPFTNPISESQLPSGYHYEYDNLNDHPIMILDEDERVVVKLTKYVGIQEKDLKIAEANGKHVNNAGSPDPPYFTPPVVATFDAGYDYVMYEGFPTEIDSVSVFFIATGVNLYGYDLENEEDDPLDSTNHNTATFYLSWVDYDKPADIMILLDKQEPDHSILVETAHEEISTETIEIIDEHRPVVVALDNSFDGTYSVLSRDGYAIEIKKKVGSNYVDIVDDDGISWDPTTNTISFDFSSSPNIQPVVLYRLVSTIRMAESSSEYPTITYGGYPTVQMLTNGSSITLPSVFNTDITVNGWNMRSSDGISRSATYVTGHWAYTVGTNDLGKTVIFTPLADHGDTVYTFITSKGYFSNGEQTIKIYLNAGDEMDDLLGAGGKLNWITSFGCLNYTFDGFYSGTYYILPDDSNIGSVENSLTFIASWTADSKTLSYTVDDGDLLDEDRKTTVTVIKGSSGGGVSVISGDSVEYSSDITITMQPGEGREIDVEKTRGHIGYTLKEEYFYVIESLSEVAYKYVDGKYYKYDPKQDDWVSQSIVSKPSGWYYKTTVGDHAIESGITTVYRYEGGEWKEYAVVDVTGDDGIFTKKFTGNDKVYKTTIDDTLYEVIGGKNVKQDEMPGFCYKNTDNEYHLYSSKYAVSELEESYYLTYEVRISATNENTIDTFGNVWSIDEYNVFTMLEGTVYAYNHIINEVVSFEYDVGDGIYKSSDTDYSIGFDSKGRMSIQYIAVTPAVPLDTYFLDTRGNHFTGSGYVNKLYDSDGTEYTSKCVGSDYDYLYYDGDLVYIIDLDDFVYHQVEGEWVKIDGVTKETMFFVDSDHSKPFVEFECIMLSESVLNMTKTKEGSATLIKDGFGNVYDDWLGAPEELPDGRGYTWTFLMMEDLDITIYSKDVSVNIYFIVDKKQLPQNSNGMSVIYSDGTETHGYNVKKNYVVAFDEYYGVIWYTDASCTEPFEGMSHISGTDPTFYTRDYQYYAKKNLTLYTRTQTYSVFAYDYSGSNYERYDLKVVDGKITLPTTGRVLSDHLFVGWAVIPEGETERFYTYAPGEAVSISASYLENGNLKIYGYYLSDSSKITYYDNTQHRLEIVEDPTLDKQHGLLDGQLLIEYSGSETALHVGEYLRNYTLVIDISNNSGIYGNSAHEYLTSGVIGIEILRGDGYVVAPSQSTRGSSGTVLSVSVSEIDTNISELKNGSAIDEYKVELVTNADLNYGTILTGPGVVHTRVNITDQTIVNDYDIHYIDGAIVIYDEGSSKHEYIGGLT